MRIRVVADPHALSSEAATAFVMAVGQAIYHNELCLLALAGGRTPRAMYRLISSTNVRGLIPWWRLEFYWGDERPVPPGHIDSNYGMAQETLLTPLGIPARQVHRMRGEASDLDAAAEDYQREIAAITGSLRNVPSLDLVLLGMGPDGHIASLFPGTAALHVTDRWVVANKVPALGTVRLTLTFPLILAAQRVHVLVSGAEKADALKRVLEGPWDPDVLPAQRLREAGDRVLWLVDADAARLLEQDVEQPDIPPSPE